MAAYLLPTQLLIAQYIVYRPSAIGHFYLVGLLYYNVAANGRQLLYSNVHCFYMLAFGPPAGPRYYLQYLLLCFCTFALYRAIEFNDCTRLFIYYCALAFRMAVGPQLASTFNAGHFYPYCVAAWPSGQSCTCLWPLLFISAALSIIYLFSLYSMPFRKATIIAHIVLSKYCGDYYHYCITLSS